MNQYVDELDKILSEVLRNAKAVPRGYATGADFRNLIDKFGFDGPGLAGALGYEPSTFQQYLKPSVETNREVLLKALRCMKDELEQTPQALHAFNRAVFCRAKLNLYSSKLDPVSVDKLDIQPRLFFSAEAAADVSHEKGEISWQTWQRNIESYFNETPQYAAHANHLTCIVGHPGGGKTTLLQSLLSDDNSARFTTVYLPLRIYNREGEGDTRSVIEAIATVYRAAGWSNAVDLRKYLKNEMDRRRLLILADGLDEVMFARRMEVFEQIRRTQARIVLTSRYVAPRLDSVDALQTFFLAGMSRDGVIKHIKYVIDLLSESNGPDTSSGGPRKSIEVLERAVEELKDTFRQPTTNTTWNLRGEVDPLKAFRDDSVDSSIYTPSAGAAGGILLDGPGIAQSGIEKIEEAVRKQQRRRKDLDVLLSSPIFVNIFIGALIDNSYVKFTITSLLKRYTHFLLGKWRDSRSPILLGLSDASSFDKDLAQILSAIGFLSCVFEHCLGRPLLKDDVVEHITKFLARLKGDDRESFVERVHKILQAASDAEILQADKDFADVKICRFKAPEELLAQVFASSFMLTALMIADHPAYMRRIGAGGDADLPIHYARLTEFATNPNLRFLEDAAVSMLISTVEESIVVDLFVEESIDFLMENFPIDFAYMKEAGLTIDQGHKLLPLNLIVAAKAFANQDLVERCGRRAEIVKQTVADIYLDTNIELVYQSLQPHCDNEELRNLGSRSQTAEVLDRKWRQSNSCADLLQISRESKKLPSSSRAYNMQLIERRIAYRMRYHWDTFDLDAFEWLTEFANGRDNQTADSGDAHATGFSSYSLLVLNTIRIIYANLRAVRGPSEAQKKTIRAARNWIVEIEARADPKNLEFEAFAKSLRVGKFDADKIVDTLLPVDKGKRLMPFFVWKNLPVALSGLILPKTFVDRAALVARLKQELEGLQRARGEASGPMADGYPIEREAACAFLLSMSIDSYESQQLFVPPKYSLKGLGLGKAEIDDKAVPYDREELIVDLFRGIKLALGEPEGVGDRDRIVEGNSIAYSVGGWQLYDYYAQALWRVVRYVPTASYLEYLR